MGIPASALGAVLPVATATGFIGKSTTSGNTFGMTVYNFCICYQGLGLISTTTFISHPSRIAQMAMHRNFSSNPWYIAITRMDQEVMSRMMLVDFATLDMQNATLAAKELKDFIATLAGLPPSQVKNQIAQLNE
jgi:hypothetical protein